jgi:hypothetical protein
VAKKKRISRILTSDLDALERVKRLTVIAMFSDDEFMQRFVLKGGNALDLVLHVGTRSSMDIDLSMENDFDNADLADVRQRLEDQLRISFRPEHYEVFDVQLEPMPEKLSPDLASFWGGYTLTFKLIDAERYHEFVRDLEGMRRNAVQIGPKGKFQIDISKFEYCQPKKAQDFEGYRIFVYTPEMVVCEKLRAICQQMPEYGPVIKRTRPPTARARDFLDIHAVTSQLGVNMLDGANLLLLRRIFEVKRVPIELLGKMEKYLGFHRPDFEAVKASVKPGVELREFDYYFNYVVTLCDGILKTFRDK